MTNSAGTTSAAIKILTSNAMRTALDTLAPRFAREIGHRVEVSYDPAKIMMERIRRGETGDVVILTAAAVDELAAQGAVAPGSRVVLARCGCGVAVPAGAPKPDIRSVEAFRRALLDAKSIACTSSGASGIHFARLIERLGIAAQMKARLRVQPGGLVGKLAATGEADFAVQQIPELLAVPGIDVVGPLPEELQQITVIAGGVFSGTTLPDAARALLAFLSTPAAAQVFKAKGLEPAVALR